MRAEVPACLRPEPGIQNRHPKHLTASLPLALLLLLARCHPPRPAVPQPCAPTPAGSRLSGLASCGKAPISHSPRPQLWPCLWSHSLQHPPARGPSAPPPQSSVYAPPSLPKPLSAGPLPPLDTGWEWLPGRGTLLSPIPPAGHGCHVPLAPPGPRTGWDEAAAVPLSIMLGGAPTPPQPCCLCPRCQLPHRRPCWLRAFLLLLLLLPPVASGRELASAASAGLVTPSSDYSPSVTHGDTCLSLHAPRLNVTVTKILLLGRRRGWRVAKIAPRIVHLA